uniref:Repressor LexA n=1 Tax=candidate division WOR-3 bacterium TaxID=2052148 RepID=A0A7C4Y4Q6_UNCW3
METRKKVYMFVKRYYEEKKIAPTIREVARFLGFKSTKAVKVHIDNLVKEGLLKKEKKKARGIYPVEAGLPILGKVPAGYPLLRFENIEGYINFSQFDGCFLLKVEGDSMKNAHIVDGDYVIVQPQNKADSGDIVVARVDDEFTIKRLKIKDGKYVLSPENEEYRDIECEFEIVGKVKGVIRRLL